MPKFSARRHVPLQSAGSTKRPNQIDQMPSGMNTALKIQRRARNHSAIRERKPASHGQTISGRSGKDRASAKVPISTTPEMAEPVSAAVPIRANRIGAAQAGMLKPKARP